MVNACSLAISFFSRLFSKKSAKSPSGEGLALRQVAALKLQRRLPSLAQLQHFPRILSPKERRMFFSGLCMSILGVLFLLFGTMSAFSLPVPRQGGTLTEGMLGYPQLINPLYADANSVDRELTHLIYSGLLSYNPQTSAIEPLLAESLSLSEDEKIYTVTLKSHVVWQDGEPFGARDVLFTFNALQNAAYGSPLFDAYQNIVVSQVDDRTLTFTLTEPYAAFAELLTVGILPAHLWEEVPPANAKLVPLNVKPVGTGPYALEKTTKDSRGIIRSIALASSDTFPGTAPYLDTIVVKFFSNTADIIQALQTKRIDTTGALSLADAYVLRDDQSLAITPLPLAQYVGAFFNTTTKALQDASLRRALTLALDVSAITADATGNLGNPLGFALPGLGATPATVQDIPTATSLLDELGYVVGESGKRMNGDKELALTLITAQRSELARAAERIADSWRALGITVTLQTLGATDMGTALKEKNYDVLVAAEQYGIIADPYPFWHSSSKGPSGLNMSQFSTPATDAAVSTLRTSTLPEKRSDAFATLSSAMIADMPAVFLFQNVLPFVHTVDIMGITPQHIPTASLRWSLERAWYRYTSLSWKF